MLDSFLQGLITISQPVILLAIFLATIFAIIMGIIPGISGGFAIVIILPFIFGRDPEMWLPVLVVLSAVSYTGGSITSVLIGVPGDASNAATIIDGFAMTRKGEGPRALGAALTASMMGGVAAVAFAFFMMPMIIPVVLMFGMSEMFFMIVVGLCFLAVMTRGSAIKGLISACLGILISTIGYQAVTGVARFTFGNIYLYDGIEITVIVLGVFAVPILTELSIAGKTIAPQVDRKAIGTYREMLQGCLDVLRHWWLWLRCTVIGYIVGVIPGIGASTGIWVSYAHAKQTSKHPEEFGTGRIEGVIAPESANNAVVGGALLTTLAFGIPGSGTMVLLLAAFLIMGIQPGTKMLTEHTVLSFSLLQTVALSNILAGIICFFFVPYLEKVTRISPVYLFCFILPVVFIGIYAFNERTLDLLILLVVAVFAIVLSRFGYSLPSLILGFVLGRLFEEYFWLAFSLDGPLFFMRPISLILVFIIIVIMTWTPISRTLKHWLKLIRKGEMVKGREARPAREPEARKVVKIRPGAYIIIGILMIALFTGSFSLTYPDIKTRFIPLLISGFIVLLAVIDLKRELVTDGEGRHPVEPVDNELKVEDRIEPWKYILPFGWMAGFLLGIYFVGFLPSIALFSFSYLKFNGHEGWLKSIVLATVTTIVIYALFVVALQAPLFPGLVFGGY